MKKNELPMTDAAPGARRTNAVTAPRAEEPHAALERALIDEFLAERGHTMRSVAALSAPKRDSLLRAAAAFATLRLAEIEAKAHFVDEID
jgi:hypothetical protein